LGANTDPYQPIERRYRVTRQILETLSACNHPATIVTKGAALIERDIELLASMAERKLMAVYVSVTTLDKALKRTLEPRAASPASRLAVMAKLAAAGVPVGLIMAPVIPVLTDHEAERIVEAAARAGATTASYAMLRLPHEVAALFREWLETHEPLKASHVFARLHELRGGRDNDPRFGSRLRGEGIYADLFKKRFELACRKHGLNRERRRALDTSRFTPPAAVGKQIRLL
jgi:DNA repair photolyase